MSLPPFAAAKSDPLNLNPALRRPTALAMTKDGKWLYAANQASGTISVIDCSSLKVTSEVAVGNRLADLAMSPDEKQLIAIDQTAGKVILLNRGDAGLTPAHRIKVAASPVSVQLAPDGSHCSVACLWPRQLCVMELGVKPSLVRTVDLPFAPRNQLMLGHSKLVVTEAFGGRVAVVDVSSGAVESVRSIPAHNIRGLATSADRTRLYLTEQQLNSQGHAQFDDIRWGNLITNNLLSLRISSVLDPKADILAGSDLTHLGGLDHGTGDPSGIAVCRDRLAVTLAGIDEVAVGRDGADAWQYVPVGVRPTAIVCDPKSRRAFVVNTGSDSISVVDLEKAKQTAEVKLGPRRELTEAERGEDLFYDAKLSHQGWLSCHSCHTDGHTSGKLADTFGDNSYATPKRILSLRGVGETGPWAWNGSMKTLEEQVKKSIQSTMQGPKPTPAQVHDLTAFLKTLAPAPALNSPKNGDAVAHGQAIFAQNNCARCHTPPLFTSAATYDVGLRDEAGLRTFNPPSLRGVSQGGPYFHDGRAATLNDVFSRFHHQLKAPLNTKELADLAAFLSTL